jgi:hypothetical protein
VNFFYKLETPVERKNPAYSAAGFVSRRSECVDFNVATCMLFIRIPAKASERRLGLVCDLYPQLKSPTVVSSKVGYVKGQAQCARLEKIVTCHSSSDGAWDSTSRSDRLRIAVSTSSG